MRPSHLFFLAFLSVASSACATATLQQRTAVLQHMQEMELTLPPSEPERMPFRAGQWVQFTIDSETGNNNIILRTIKVLQVDGDTVTIEVDSREALNNGRLDTELYVIQGFPVTPRFDYTARQKTVAINSTSFKKVLRKKGDAPVEVWPEELLVFSKDWLRKIFLNGHILGDVEPRRCSSGIIYSPRCYEYRFKLKILNFETGGRIKHHSGIPIVGFIERYDTFGITRVTSFGLEGAEGRLQP